VGELAKFLSLDDEFPVVESIEDPTFLKFVLRIDICSQLRVAM
jgi:hypothetical protein